MILIAVAGVWLSELQLEVLMTLEMLVRVQAWHPNLCGCCVTAHTRLGTLVIGRDGGFDFFYPGEVPLSPHKESHS